MATNDVQASQALAGRWRRCLPFVTRRCGGAFSGFDMPGTAALGATVPASVETARELLPGAASAERHQ